MFAQIAAAAGTTTTVDIDVISELNDPCNLSGVSVFPDANNKPTYGDSIAFFIFNPDGSTIDKPLGSCGINPDGNVDFTFENGPEATYTELSGGQKLRCIYNSIGTAEANVIVNVQASF